jgi:hypothetical protein
MRNVSEKVVEKITMPILCSVKVFLQKSRHFLGNMKKYCRADQATDDNMAHCMLDT